MPEGQEFVKHEFDEAIAVQQSIVRGATELSQVHPMPDSKRELKTAARESEQWLKKLQKRGQQFGATGEKEEVAQGIDQLANTTLANARSGEASEVYEAQAVLINALRKQQDSAGSVIKIAQGMKDREMAAEAREMQRAAKKSADGLAKNLTQLAVMIAMQGQEPPTGGRSTGSRGGSSRGRSASGGGSTRGRTGSSGGRSTSSRSGGGSSR